MKHEGASEQAWIDAKRAARMQRIDEMPQQLREMVHQYGLNVVTAFLQSGVSSPKAMRHCVETVLDEFSPTRGSFSSQGKRVSLINPPAA